MDKIGLAYKNALALKDVMLFSVGAEENIAGKYTSYPTFLRKFREIRDSIKDELDLSLVDDFYKDATNPFDLTWPQQKQIYDMVLTSLNILISRLAVELNIKKDKIEELRSFFKANIRRAVLHDPKSEQDIQDVVETLLIGRGYEKGLDYDREVGRVKYSIKESTPDFIMPKFNLAIEVKFSTTAVKSKSIIDQINTDIIAYSQKYENLLFIVYDMGTIRDEDEFKQDIEKSRDGVRLMVLKH